MILGEIATIKNNWKQKIMKFQIQHEFLQKAEIKCIHYFIAILRENAAR